MASFVDVDIEVVCHEEVYIAWVCLQGLNAALYLTALGGLRLAGAELGRGKEAGRSQRGAVLEACIRWVIAVVPRS